MKVLLVTKNTFVSRVYLAVKRNGEGKEKFEDMNMKDFKIQWIKLKVFKNTIK